MSELDDRSRELRRYIVSMLEHGGRGHLASAFSLVEMLRVLYDSFLQYRPDQPRWEGRDRLILSKGHGCMALYALLADRGFYHDLYVSQFRYGAALSSDDGKEPADVTEMGPTGVVGAS